MGIVCKSVRAILIRGGFPYVALLSAVVILVEIVKSAEWRQSLASRHQRCFFHPIEESCDA